MEVDTNGGEAVEVPDDDHTYNMPYPSGLPHKKISRSQKLQTSIKLGQQLLKGVNHRNELMESYYIKKMAYMDHRMKHDEKMLKAVENSTAAVNSLLVVIANKYE